MMAGSSQNEMQRTLNKGDGQEEILTTGLKNMVLDVEQDNKTMESVVDSEDATNGTPINTDQLLCVPSTSKSLEEYGAEQLKILNDELATSAKDITSVLDAYKKARDGKEDVRKQAMLIRKAYQMKVNVTKRYKPRIAAVAGIPAENEGLKALEEVIRLKEMELKKNFQELLYKTLKHP